MIEVIFSIFYLSGLIKSFLINYDINLFLDFTLLSSLLLILLILKKKIQKKITFSISTHNLQVFYILLFFLIWTILTLFYTQSEKYSYEKVLLFLTNILAFSIPIFLPSFNVKKVIQIVVITVPVLTIVYLVLMYKYQTNIELKEVYRQISGLYLTCGGLLGINIIILYTSKKRIFNQRAISIILLVLSIVLLLLLGARGPIFFTIISIVLFEIYRFYKVLLKGRFSIEKLKFSFINVTYISLSLIITFIIFFTYKEEINVLFERSLMRLNLILDSNPSGDMGDSVNTRVEQIKLSLNLIFSDFKSFIFGYGVGSYGILENNIDGRAYPHNIFLEIWVELGFIGLLIFILFLVKFISKKSTNQYINFVLIVFILLNSLKSNSIVDIRIYFALIAMYLISPQYHNNNETIN